MQHEDLSVDVRDASAADVSAIARIYAQGVEDRVATLEADAKSDDEIAAWLFGEPSGQYPVVVASVSGEVVGWAALRPATCPCTWRAMHVAKASAAGS